MTAEKIQLEKKIYGLGIRNRLEGFDAALFSNPSRALVNVTGVKVQDHLIIEKSGTITLTVDVPENTVNATYETRAITIKKNTNVILQENVNVAGKGLLLDRTITVEAGAQLTLLRELQAANAYVFSNATINLKTGATLIIKESILQGTFVRHHTTTILDEKSDLNHKTLFRTSKEHDIKACAQLRGKNAKATLAARGVVEAGAKSLFLGEVDIAKNASGCVGHQRSDLLLLSETAIGEAVPILQVENNDVICSHSATISQLDEETVFYLQSRGLSKDAAQKMVVEGFLEQQE